MDFLNLKDKDSHIHISKQNQLLYIVITIVIVYFFTTVVKIELGHILALIVTTFVLIYLTLEDSNNIEDINTELEFKLNSLLDNQPPPDYFYIDADLITLFYNIRQDFAEFNYPAYKDAIECVNIVLNVRYDAEQSLCASPKVPNILQNFEPNFDNVNGKPLNSEFKERSDFLNIDTYRLKQDTKCNSTLENGLANFQLAEENVKNCMNYLHSMIITTPSNPVLHMKHNQIMNRAHILLKRHLDYIKSRVKSKKDGIIHDYDLPKAINKHMGDNSNFNVY